MKRYFVIGEKKYVKTGEFVKMQKGKVYERIDIYNKNTNQKISSAIYSEKKIQNMLEEAAKTKK